MDSSKLVSSVDSLLLSLRREFKIAPFTWCQICWVIRPMVRPCSVWCGMLERCSEIGCAWVALKGGWEEEVDGVRLKSGCETLLLN
jgi:hypothetical protein